MGALPSGPIAGGKCHVLVRPCIGVAPGALARLAAWSVRHRAALCIATALLMALLASGASRLVFDEDPFDALPTGDPHAQAAERLIGGFAGNAYASPVFVSVAPDKWAMANQQLPNRAPQGSGSASPLETLLRGQGVVTATAYPGPLNITDEVYMRGMDEMYEFVRARVPEVTWGITLPSEVRLVNYTNTGIPGVRAPDPAAFTMPGTGPDGAVQYQAAWQTFFASSPDAVKTIVSADWRSSRLVFLMEPDGQSLDAMGAKIYAAVEAYRSALIVCDAGPDCSLAWNVFDHDDVIVDPRGAPAASHHLSETTWEDLVRLAPLVALFIAASLLVAFRRPATVAAVLLPLGLAGIGIVGTLGWLGIPMHSVSLLVFPIVMGNGIDFGIHMASAYHGARQRGLGPAEAAAAAGERAGVPLALATLTTLAGIALLVAAPNRMLSQLGIAILVGMALLLAVSLTTLPAALSWTTSPRGGLGTAPGLARFASFWRRHRTAAATTVVVLLLVAVPAASRLDTFVLGTPAADFGPDDPQRRDFDASNDRYFVDDEDLVSNVLVLEGDLTTPAAMELMTRLQDAMRGLPFVRSESVSSIRFAMESWLMVREGTAAAPVVIARESAQPGSTFPTTQAGIRAVIDEMFATPLATYASFFIDAPDYRLGTMLVEIRQAQDFEVLERDWQTLLDTVERVAASVPGHDINIHVAGQTAVSYLFTAKELPYLATAAVIGPVLTGGIIWVARRSLRDGVVVASVIAATGLWWLACLAILDIPLSIALVVPVVVISAIGSDYALHLRHGARHDGHGAWATVGRAVLYSAITDIGAFLIFTRMRYGLLHDAALATVAALACALAATLLVVPLMDPARKVQPVPAALAQTPQHAAG